MAAKKVEKITKYGLCFAPELIRHPADIELILYCNDKIRESSGKALSKDDHMREAIKLLMGSEFSFNRWSNQLIDAWCSEDIITVWGSSATGKSGTMAAICLVDLLAAPLVTNTVIVTSPMAKHDDRCWGSFKRWYSMVPKELSMGETRQAPKLGLPVNRDGQYAGIVCISTKEGESMEDLKSKIGSHQKRNRLLVDEPQHCSESILSIKANMGASGDYKEAFFGNPDSWHSPLGKHSMPLGMTTKDIEEKEPQQWRTTQKWRGKQGLCIVFDGRDSPRDEDPSITFMAGEEHISDLITNHGEDSLQLWTYGIGRMPPSGASNTCISDQDLRNSGAMDKPFRLFGEITRIMGLDPSEGRDGCVQTLIELGINEDGFEAINIVKKDSIQVKVKGGDISGQIAKAVNDKRREWGVTMKNLAQDAGGNQNAQADRIEAECGERGIFRVISAGSATKRKVSDGKVSKDGAKAAQAAQDIYSNKATEMLMNLANIIRQGRVRGIDSRVAHQITTRKAEMHNGKLKVEEKKDWRGRNSNKSPDDMDAVVVALECAIERGLIKTYLPSAVPSMAKYGDILRGKREHKLGRGSLHRRGKGSRMAAG